MSVYEKLKSLAITLPGVTPPVAAFVPVLRSGNLIFISGHIAKKDGKPWAGQLGADITTADGKEAARGIAIDLMGALEAATGNLDSIRRIVSSLTAPPNCSPKSSAIVASTPGARSALRRFRLGHASRSN